MGAFTMFLLLETLGLRLAILKDDEAVRRLGGPLPSTLGRQVRRGTFTHPPNERIVRRVLRHVADTWNWSDILLAVSAARKTLAEEQEAKEAARAAKRAAATKPPRLEARPAA